MDSIKKRIGILGGGPAALFMYKRLLETGEENLEIEIFERTSRLGAGMPYSSHGANNEHVTNVSGNEIPDIAESFAEWIHSVPSALLKEFNIELDNFNDYKVLPRLLFGQYLEDQFALLLKQAKLKKVGTTVHFGTEVMDVEDFPDTQSVKVTSKDGTSYNFDSIVVCTGHKWPNLIEATIPNYFDGPYPPSKIALKLNHAVALRGASLTAVDAIRTLARNNGQFEKQDNGELRYISDNGSEEFKIVMHTRNGLLPAVRFHLEDSHLKNGTLLSEEEITLHRSGNGGFLSLDYIFEKDFKDVIRKSDPEFYNRIKDLSMEGFVAEMMELRERLDPFVLLKAEYTEAQRSIKRKESVFWKEMLAVLSFAMNYPAKYFSAEDMLRLRGTLMPLISIVIAFIPQTSCRELLSLHSAGKLEMVAVGEDSEVEPELAGGITYRYTNEAGDKIAERFHTFVDCIGQSALQYEDIPFRGLVENKTVSPARLRFQNPENGTARMANGDANVQLFDGEYYLRVPGIGINDSFQVLNQYGAYSERIYIMAVPYIGGYNPDYSGLDFAEEASGKIISAMQQVSAC